MNRAGGEASPQRHRPLRRRQLAQLLPLVCALAILGGAACGASTSPSATRTTAAPTPADSATPTPTPDPDTAIISAYEQAETTYLHLEEVPQDNAAALAELQQWFVNPALTSHQQQLEFYVADGERVSGTSQPGTPIITSISGGTASLQECVYFTTETVYIASGQPLPGSVTGYALADATLVLQGGTWHVSVDGPTTYEGADGCNATSPSP